MLTEGRKENIVRKYAKRINAKVMNYLNSKFQAKTNYKYAEWVIKTYLKMGKKIDISDIDTLVQEFDKYRKNLELTDINSYESYQHLKDIVDKYKEGRPKKPTKDERVVVYRNDDVLIVRPKTHAASCKYGSGTMWCTTQLSKNHFKRYLSDGVLYYVIFKGLSQSNPYYKMALHYKFKDHEKVWYDSLDEKVTPNNLKLLELLLTKDVLDAIDDDFDKFHEENITGKGVRNIINPLELDIKNLSGEVNGYIYYLSSEYDMPTINDFSTEFFITEKDGDTYAKGDVEFIIKNDGDIQVSIEIDEGFGSLYDGLFGNTNVYVLSSKDFTVKDLEKLISGIIDKLPKETEVDESFEWSSNSSKNTYRFTNGGKLTNKFKEYLDNLGVDGLGSKVDFLLFSGQIKKSKDGGYISQVSKKPINIHGYHSNFFTALKDAKVIEYVRDGRQYKFRRGPGYQYFIGDNLRHNDN
jgi:hypothetical protein